MSQLKDVVEAFFSEDSLTNYQETLLDTLTGIIDSEYFQSMYQETQANTTHTISRIVILLAQLEEALTEDK